MTETAKYFNAQAAGWDARTTPVEKLKHVVEAAGIHAGDTVLEVGTGTGVLLPHIAEAVGTFGSIDAMDISSEMLALAHHKNARLPLPVRFMLADIETDPVHQLYDRIILFDVLPHLSHPLETLTRLFVNNLNGGGTITIAGATSREKANELHAALPLACHQLPPASVLADRFTDLGVKVDYVEDNDQYYILRVRRR